MEENRKPSEEKPREKESGEKYEGRVRTLLGSFTIAWSMYSRVPMPQIQWTRERMRYAMCFFPLIGVFTGGAVLCFFLFSKHLGAGEIFVSLGGAALPLLITGGIHMDGFLDTTDARRSFLSRERKLEILKDPHTGAFAVIGCSLYLISYAALFSELDIKGCLMFSGVFAAERAFSGMSVVSFPMAKSDGLAASFAQASLKRTVRGVMAVYLAVCGLYFLAVGKTAFGSFLPGLFCIVISGAVFIWYYRLAKKEFGGMTGDLAGYFLQSYELVLLFTVAAVGWFW